MATKGITKETGISVEITWPSSTLASELRRLFLFYLKIFLITVFLAGAASFFLAAFESGVFPIPTLLAALGVTVFVLVFSVLIRLSIRRGLLRPRTDLNALLIALLLPGLLLLFFSSILIGLAYLVESAIGVLFFLARSKLSKRTVPTRLSSRETPPQSSKLKTHS